MRSLEEEDRALDALAVTRAATEQALSGGDGPMGPKPTAIPETFVDEYGPAFTVAPHVTTNATLADDLRASLKARDGSHAGHTWGSFKTAMEYGLGVTNDDVIASIEYGCGKTASGILVREDAPDGIEIRETR